MRKYTLLISLTLILFLILYNLVNLFFFKEIISKKKDEIVLINSIDKYLKFTHHVREFKFITNKNQSIEKLFYSKRITNENNKLIIFQGDSWAEQNVLYNKSNMFLNNFVSKFSLNFIDAGVSSYSFSPMNLQLNYLKKNLNYSPDIVVALVDHTDIADEYCRYKDKLIFKNNKLKKILLEKENSGEIYNYKLEYQKKIENIITIDEQTKPGGLGSLIRENNPRLTYLKEMCLSDEFIFENLGRDKLLDKYGLSINLIKKNIQKIYK